MAIVRKQRIKAQCNVVPEHRQPHFRYDLVPCLALLLWPDRASDPELESRGRLVRGKVELHKRFQQAEDAICGINLRRLPQRKQHKGGAGENVGTSRLGPAPTGGLSG